MTNPVICGRPGCGHRLRMHNQGPDGPQGCFSQKCSCYDFVEPGDRLIEEIRMANRPDNTTLWLRRHPSVQHFEPFFAYGHLPEHLQRVSQPFSDLAGVMLARLKDGPELSAALRKLVEAKDCAVRQAVLDHG